MAFGLQYLSRIEQSQQPDPTYNSATGNVQGAIPKIWSFNAAATAANNSTAQTQAAAYFDGAVGYLAVGDLIWVVSNDPGYHLIYIATNNGVTTTTVQLV
jgi:hypothetical protein